MNEKLLEVGEVELLQSWTMATFGRSVPCLICEEGSSIEVVRIADDNEVTQ